MIDKPLLGLLGCSDEFIDNVKEVDGEEELSSSPAQDATTDDIDETDVGHSLFEDDEMNESLEWLREYPQPPTNDEFKQANALFDDDIEDEALEWLSSQPPMPTAQNDLFHDDEVHESLGWFPSSQPVCLDTVNKANEAFFRRAFLSPPDEKEGEQKKALPLPSNKPAQPAVPKSKRMSMADLARLLAATGDFIFYSGLLYLYYECIFVVCDLKRFLTYIQEHVDMLEQRMHDIPSLRNAYTYLCSDPSIQLPELPKYYQYCGAFENGLFDAYHNTWHDFNRQWVIFSKIKARFLPDQSLPSPTFDHFIYTSSGGDPLIQNRMLECIGALCMLPCRLLKRFFVLGCAPNSGKSVIGKLLRKLYGDSLVASTTLQDLNTQFGASALLGKAINISMDLPGDALQSKAVSMLKMLTGDDSISIDKKYSERIEYASNIHMLFATNHSIKITSKDAAFWKRLVFVPFDHEIPASEQDPYLIDRLWDERDAIVTKCVLAYLDNPHFTQSRSIDATIQQWSGGNDSIQKFLEECCILDETSRVYSEPLYAAYKEYCVERNFNPVGTKELIIALRQMAGVIEGRWRDGNENKRGLKGIGLL